MYCIRCRKETDSENITKKLSKNNRLMLMSECSECGCKRGRFIKAQEGEGIKEVLEQGIEQGKKIIRGTKKIIKEGISKTLRLEPPQMNKALEKYGDYTITGIRACRHPIRELVTKALNFVIGGKLAEKLKELNYDKLYHLFLNLTIEKDGKKKYFRTERNQRVTAIISDTPYNEKPEDQCMDAVSFPKGMTLKEFIRRGEKVGGSEFYRYHPINNNCQEYLMTLTKANKVKGLDKFIKQELDDLLSPAIQKIAQGITDVANLADVVLSGGRKKK